MDILIIYIKTTFQPHCFVGNQRNYGCGDPRDGMGMWQQVSSTHASFLEFLDHWKLENFQIDLRSPKSIEIQLKSFLLPIEFLWTCSLQDTCFVGLLLWIKTPVSGEELLMSGTWTHSGLLELTQKLFDGWMVIWGTFRSHSPLSLVLWLDFCPAMVDCWLSAWHVAFCTPGFWWMQSENPNRPW